MKNKFLVGLAILIVLSGKLPAAPFDAAPFALPLPEGNGLLWEDPREIHQVVAHFAAPPPTLESVRLEYWGSHWPNQHLPKDRQPGGGDVGWMELGNWYRGGWRVADTESRLEGSNVVFTFRPINAKEFPSLTNYSAAFRYTLKVRIVSDKAVPKLEGLEAFTDSVKAERSVKVCFKAVPRAEPRFEAFNGEIRSVRKLSPRDFQLNLDSVVNPDPNTLDRTLVTVRNGKATFSFATDDLSQGALFVSVYGAAVLDSNDQGDYASVAAEQKRLHGRTLYDRVGGMPEQSWRNAWDNIPPKKSRIYFPLGLDGGRQRFRLDPDGSVRFRSNDHYLRGRPGQDTERLQLEPGPVRFTFGPELAPKNREIADSSIPICTTFWEDHGVAISQTAFVTKLAGTAADEPVPPADCSAVFIAQFTFTNTSSTPQVATLPVTYTSANNPAALRPDDSGLLWLGDNLRGQVITDTTPVPEKDVLVWKWTLEPHQGKSAVVKIPYVLLTQPAEREALGKLKFETERSAIAGYWQRRLNESSHLITPEPILNDFYRAVAGHLLINCELEPNKPWRFARVGSFAYGAYGNESCMMVVDLDRRGYHREAQECLDAWLHYQGTAALPGDFASKEGVLYGAGGYEAGGYNQHHGWILWCMAEHYRFTRDEAWLRSAAPGILAGADWVIRETKRTADRHELEHGLLPAGSLEDIGDWWTWLSTSCYTWCGLDSAAWALEQIRHPEAGRVRAEADAFHAHLLTNFHKASERSPVVRLRDGTSVPKIPSYVHRRGRSFGWICETLEGSLHLLITGALKPDSEQAGWILNDYEDNLYLSNQYGYTLTDFDKYWFGRGGMSMQACLLFTVEPYLRRDNVKHALRAMFNAIAVSHFPDVHINTEHALPNMDDWRGDHYKSSDEANACGWLREIFLREQDEALLVGQAVPRDWLRPGQKCGIEHAATYFGPTTIVYTGSEREITAQLDAPTRNPPKQIRLRFRPPDERPLVSVTVNGEAWKRFKGEWIELPGDIRSASVVARFRP